MAVPLTRLSRWWWGGKEKGGVSNGSTTNSFPDLSFDLKEPRSVRGTKMEASNRRVKKKWKSREERKIDKEYDVVLVPSDGGVCLSESDSYDSDWSVGWLEPHAPDFQSDEDGDNSFAVLVPCYKIDSKQLEDVEPSNHFRNAIKNLPIQYSSEGKKYMEQWLSSLQSF